MQLETFVTVSFLLLSHRQMATSDLVAPVKPAIVSPETPRLGVPWFQPAGGPVVVHVHVTLNQPPPPLARR